MMTPDEIRSQRFAAQVVGGFSRDEVAAFLEDVAEAYEDLQLLNASLMERVKALEAEIQSGSARSAPSARPGKSLPDTETVAESVERPPRDPEPTPLGNLELLRAAALQEIEALLHDAQAKAHTVLESAKEQAAAMLQEAETARARLQLEADSFLAGAMAKADALVAEARDQAATYRAENERLMQSRLQLVDEIRGTIDTYLRRLETLDPRGRDRDERDTERSTGDPHAVDASDRARVG